jgi:hypothetical protein
MGQRKADHIWSKDDIIVALYYYRFGTKFLELDEKQLARAIGTTVDSLKTQSKNFEMLDKGKSTLSDYSQIQGEVYNEFGKCVRYTLFKEVKKSLDLDRIIMEKLVKSKSLKGVRRLKPLTR